MPKTMSKSYTYNTKPLPVYRCLRNVLIQHLEENESELVDDFKDLEFKQQFNDFIDYLKFNMSSVKSFWTPIIDEWLKDWAINTEKRSEIVRFSS